MFHMIHKKDTETNLATLYSDQNSKPGTESDSRKCR